MFKAIFNKVEVSQGTKGTQASVHSVFKFPPYTGKGGAVLHSTSHPVLARHTDRQTDRHIDTVTYRQTSRQARRQAGRGQTSITGVSKRQRVRQKDRHNHRSKDGTQTQQQRPKSPTVTVTWHASKCNVQKLHHRCILWYVCWSFCILYLFACQLRVTVSDPSFCCYVCVTSFEC